MIYLDLTHKYLLSTFNSLLCSYHMECLTPAVAYVPIDEWYCPACSSRIQPHVDPEELLHEGHAEEGLGDVPRVRATRGRPRGSTARRVSALGRTGLYMRMMFLHVSTCV